MAYQGFGDGLEQDVQGLRFMADNVEEILLRPHARKNFSLYRERTGAAAKSLEEVGNAKGRLLTLACDIHHTTRSWCGMN